jgi:predicted nucleic acid-binding protein
LSFADAYYVVIMEQLAIEEIVSFDQGFDRASSVRRVEP